MNIEKTIGFKPENPAILQIIKSKQMHYFAVGLLKGQTLKAHKTAVPAMLTVLKGSIDFRLNETITKLRYLDTFAIPSDIMHEVTGLEDENIFSLVKEG